MAPRHKVAWIHLLSFVAHLAFRHAYNSALAFFQRAKRLYTYAVREKLTFSRRAGLDTKKVSLSKRPLGDPFEYCRWYGFCKLLPAIFGAVHRFVAIDMNC